MEKSKGKGKPTNPDLYQSIKEKIYKEQPKHSLFRSARIVKEYKQEKGKFEEDSNKNKMNIPIWLKQNWISLNDYARGDIVPCGSSNTQDRYNEYPLCRPLAITEQLTKPQIKEMIKQKNILKEKPIKTEKITGNKKLNIGPTKTGLKKTKL